MIPELWDAYDREGNLAVDRTLVRGEPIPDGLYHLVCEVLVRHADGDCLLMRRDPSKEMYGGYYEATAGGSALKGEDALACIRRELREETGLSCDDFTLVARQIRDGDGTIFCSYVCTVDCEKDSVTLQQGETVAYKWVSEDEFVRFLRSDECIDLQRERFRDWFESLGYLPSRLARVKWIFFDVGSTLLDETECHRRRFDEIVESGAVARDDLKEKVIEFAQNSPTPIKDAAKYFGVTLPKWHSELERPYPDVPRVLTEFRGRGYRLGVIANQSLGTAERLEMHEIRHFFDVIAASAEEGVAKPDPRLFEIALDRAGCPAADAAMVGDRLDNDIVPAKALGMPTVRVLQGFATQTRPSCEAEEPYRSVSDFADLLDLFE